MCDLKMATPPPKKRESGDASTSLCGTALSEERGVRQINNRCKELLGRLSIAP
jgi:hypothetical protein